MFRAYRRWRRQRILNRHPLPEADWQWACGNLPWLARLRMAELERLRRFVTWFMREKRFFGAAGLTPERDMCLTVAVLACLPVLELDYDWLDGWTTVILYPGEFRARHTHEDESGLVSEEVSDLAGEAWEGGPLVLSWMGIEAGIEWPEDGENVVFHEIAHKLDMLNGDPNGMPPLHRHMDRREWAQSMQQAFEAMNRALDRDEDTAIDPYAATDPAEFFAVTSEYFFEAPGVLRQAMPAVHDQLALFYRDRHLVRASA